MTSPSPALSPSPSPSTEEHFDVLTAAGVATGAASPRSLVHRDGLWHRSTHIWVVSPARRAVLLQKRAAAKDTFPGLWDVSAAGHISAGEESADTARREMEEELGLAGEVRFLFTAAAEAVGEAGGKAFVDRELQDIYLFEGEVAVADVLLQEEEVEEVRYWDVDEYCRALEAEDDRFVPRSKQYKEKFLPFLSDYLGKAE